MQDEVNEKTVSLCIRCGKVTANLLKAAMVKALAKMEQEKKQQGQKISQKQLQKEKEDKTYKGKQSLDKLMKQNVQLSNIEITDGNIKSFERVAKKYSIDFSLKKDVTADPPRYHVFFKARDADVMTAAFKEYTGKSLNKDKKPSVRKKLQQAITKSLREIMSYDEMELDMVGDQRTALFIIISDTDDTFNFVVAMMYSQLFNLLCDRADDVHHGRLPYHVRILCDEFANIGQIPKFDKLIATIRSREISASIILQSQSQLKTIYKDAAETILGNCDTMLFLGGKESSTLKEISETLGKETIDLYNTSDTRGQSRSYGMNYQKTGKELMSRDELAVMDGSKCILQLRGVRPFFSDKFDITRHKRYKELSDYDKKNEFDVEAYMRHRMEVKLTRTQEFDLYEFSEESLAEELNTENKEAEHVKDSDT